MCYITSDAQSIKKTLPVKQEEVPVAVRQAFINEFGKIPENGFWTVDFLLEKDGPKTLSKPTAYAFNKRSKTERIEVRYTPEGKLESVKGMEKITSNTAGDSTSSLKNPLYFSGSVFYKQLKS